MRRLLVVIISALLLSGCEVDFASPMHGINTTPHVTLLDKDISHSDTTKQIDYLTETPPENAVIRFAPDGYLSNADWFWHGTPVFAPDGQVMYWSAYQRQTDEIKTYYTVKKDGAWTEEQPLIIDGVDGTLGCPIFVDGSDEAYIVGMDYFDMTYYHVRRTEAGWKNPIALEIEVPEGMILGIKFSVAKNRNIYYSLWSEDQSKGYQIYMSRYQDGQYSEPIFLPGINGDSKANGSPEVAPDESYILFESVRDEGYGMHDLYVSFRNDLGEWEEPINLGSRVNSPNEDGAAYITPEGEYLFFTTAKRSDQGYNPYWIRLDALDAMKREKAQ